MKFLNQLIKKQNIFQRSVGLNLNQFQEMAKRLADLWDKSEIERKTRENRRRKIGGGRSYKFESLEEKLLILLLYYKSYLTQEFLGMIVGMNQSNISRLLKKMSSIIETAADPDLKTYLADAKKEYDQFGAECKINDWKTFLQKHPDLADVSTDATEQKCFRPEDNEQQKVRYSGKKKQHTVKVQLSFAATGRILDVSNTYPGSVHDKKILDQEGTVKKIPPKTPHRFDLGYQGAATENPDHYIILPVKKKRKTELTAFEKELNHVHSKRRIKAEHGISRVKKFRICTNVYRGPIKSHNQIVRNVAALLNFRLFNPMISA